MGGDMEDITVLVVEDEKIHRELLKGILEERDYEVLSVTSAERAVSVLKQRSVDVVITDVKLPSMTGIELLKKIKEEWPWIEVIVITAFGDIEDAVNAVKSGAFHYLTKPYEPDVLLNLVDKCAELASFKKISKKSHSIIYSSEAMEKVLQQAKLYAASDAPVLILGESGVGKELVARFIHKESRREGNFVPVNCAAIPEELFESELFGYEKGAFTGAAGSKKGLIEEADGGTLFLDEIGEMPLSLQAKLLRFLQEKEIRRLGSTKSKKVNVRVIAATNEDLEEAMKEKRFREDLYYRLSILSLTIPPLRERKEDIPVLCGFFVEKYAKKYGKKVSLSQKALEALLNYDFPGNVRELEAIIHRAVLTAEGEITPSMLGIEEKGRELAVSLSEGETLPELMEKIEKKLLVEALERAGYVQTKAAKILGIDEKSLRYKRKKYGI